MGTTDGQLSDKAWLICLIIGAIIGLVIGFSIGGIGGAIVGIIAGGFLGALAAVLLVETILPWIQRELLFWVVLFGVIGIVIWASVTFWGVGKP